ncbi:MAG: Ig-like domain-containing protein [Imperialibacter sp.]|uniref:beta strand repeat-containing protein n=1 Tax=Imperialibacter sp. TaxID=2038411 RepID=UPI0032EB5F0B
MTGRSLTKRLFFHFIAFSFLSLFATLSHHSFGQTKGLIYKPASGGGAAVLDPNGDGYTSSSASGFVSNDETESEISYVALPSVGASEPDSDLGPGPSCGFTDLVKSDDNNTIYTYLDAGNNLMFRFRLGGTASNSKGYSILIDTDQKFGATGPNADPNYVVGNPGFEIEVVLRTNFGVGLYNVDGTVSPVEIGSATVDRPYNDYAQKSIALSEICGDDDYFYDFYIPFAHITAAFPGVTTSTPLRMVGNTVINPNAAMGNNGISDLGGIDDATGITDDLWGSLVDVFPPTSPADIGSGTVLYARASCPSITGPLAVGATSVSGTSTEVDGTIIELFKDNVSIGTTTVASGAWTKSGLTALTQGAVITATATVPSSAGTQKSTSIANCDSETVGSTCTSPPTGVAISSGTKGISGTISNPTSASITITVYNFPSNTVWTKSGLTNPVTTTGTTWAVEGGTGNFLPNGAYYAKAQAIGLGQCQSNASSIVCSGLTSSTATTISTGTVSELTSSISGTSGSAANVTLYINGLATSYTTTAVGTNWTINSISGLAVGQSITAVSYTTGNCPTTSAAKVVAAKSRAPSISGEYCIDVTGSVTTVSGVSSEDENSVIKIYTGAAGFESYTGRSGLVSANGAWTVSGLTLGVTTRISATAQTSGELESDFSAGVVINAKTPDPLNALEITSNPVEGDASISGTATVSANDLVIQLYIDGVAIDGANATIAGDLANAGIQVASWTITGLATPFDKLYAGGSATVTAEAQGAGTCESNHSAAKTIACALPASQTFSATSTALVCEGETIDFQIDGSENLIVYELINQSGVAVGPAKLGNGSPLSITTFGLSASTTSISVKAQKIGVTCETTFTPAVTVEAKPLAVVSLTSSSLQVCRGTTSVDLGYTVTANGPAIDYSIVFDAAALSAGMTSISNNTTVASPISVAVPAGIAAGTYNGSFTVRNSNSLVCTSVAKPFTITVVEAVISSALPASPTSCGGADGTITIGGLQASASYTALDYKDDGATVNHGAFVSNSSGEYQITGLNAGAYTDLTVTISGCTSTAFAGPVTISDPGGATISEGTHVQPTNCDTPNGEIVLTGVTSGTFNVNFSLDGTPQATQSISATGSGIAILNLGEGAYTNISITDASSCKSNTISGPIQLTNNSDPTISLGTSPSVVTGSTSANLPYSSTTNSPNEYTIDYDGAANTAGFADISTFAALPSSPIVLVVPGAAAANTYNGSLVVKNSSTGCISSSTAFTVTITAGGDVTPPAATITGTPTAVNSTTPYNVTVDFGEVVTGFVSGEVVVGNGSVTGFTDNGDGTFTVQITPSGAGNVTVDVAGSVATDAAGNNNTAATTATTVYDTTAPSEDIPGDPSAVNSTSP